MIVYVQVIGINFKKYWVYYYILGGIFVENNFYKEVVKVYY